MCFHSNQINLHIVLLNVDVYCKKSERNMFNHIALRMAKIVFSFDLSECSRVKPSQGIKLGFKVSLCLYMLNFSEAL